MKRLALALALSALPAAVLADVVGTYVAGDAAHRQTMTLSFRDDRHIRMDVGQGNYLLVSGDKAYMVTGAEGGNMVVDLDSLPKMALPAGAVPAAGKEPAVKVTRTGRSETVAGIRGEVFEITGDGQRHEVVLSNDKRLLGLNKAFMALGKRMAQSLGPELSRQLDLASREAQKTGYGGVLRSNQDFVLQSVRETAVPADRYALPKGAAPAAIPAMPAMPQFDPAQMQQMQQQMQQLMKQHGR